MDYIPNKSVTQSHIPLCCNKVHNETATQAVSDNRQCNSTKNEDKPKNSKSSGIWQRRIRVLAQLLHKPSGTLINH